MAHSLLFDKSDDDSGSAEFLDVNHRIEADSVFGFITKDFVKPTSIGRRFIHGSSHRPPPTFKSIYIWRSHKTTTIEWKKRRLPYKPKEITEQSKNIEISCQYDERHDYTGIQEGQ